MSDYISREEAKRRLRIWITGCEMDGDKDAANHFRDCIDLLDELPAAEVAPMVRCQKCKYYAEFRTKKNGQIMRLCYRMGRKDMEYHVNPDDFCSYGEKEEG